LYYSNHLIETYADRKDGIQTMEYLKRMVSARIWVDEIFPEHMRSGSKRLDLIPGKLKPDTNAFANRVKNIYIDTKKSYPHLFKDESPNPYFH